MLEKDMRFKWDSCYKKELPRLLETVKKNKAIGTDVIIKSANKNPPA